MNLQDNFKPVTVTEKAVSEIFKIMSAKDISSDLYGFRVGVNKAPGCGEKTFIVGFDKLSDQDMSYEVGNLSVIIKKSDVLFLDGLIVDHQDNADGKGFSLSKQSRNG
jgi:Fe-S cluster assembly iron-binding protein IscA